MREFRFAVGTAEGRRSTVWRLWTSKAEFYVQSRMMGSSAKLSIHSGGQAQWSLQSDWYRVNRPNQPNQSRHLEKWTWTEPVENRATLVFRLFIPESELRVIEGKEDLSKVEWLPLPTPQHQVVVDCFIAPADCGGAPLNDPSVLCCLERDHESSVVLFARVMPVTPEDLARVELIRSQAADLTSRASVMVKPGARLVILVAGENGARGMVEFVPLGA